MNTFTISKVETPTSFHSTSQESRGGLARSQPRRPKEVFFDSRQIPLPFLSFLPTNIYLIYIRLTPTNHPYHNIASLFLYIIITCIFAEQKQQQHDRNFLQGWLLEGDHRCLLCSPSVPSSITTPAIQQNTPLSFNI